MLLTPNLTKLYVVRADAEKEKGCDVVSVKIDFTSESWGKVVKQGEAWHSQCKG
jgi:hypothetical protein